jgi:serine/threonine protein kinase
MYANRELRVQVIGPLAHPLYKICNLKTFKKTFRSLVKSKPAILINDAPLSHNFNSVHHDLFKKAGILHRDISIGNLMVDTSNPAQGILIDLDFAARVAEHGDPLDGETFPPAGTLNFHAYDLLTPNKPLKAYYPQQAVMLIYP